MQTWKSQLTAMIWSCYLHEPHNTATTIASWGHALKARQLVFPIFSMIFSTTHYFFQFERSLPPCQQPNPNFLAYPEPPSPSFSFSCQRQWRLSSILVGWEMFGSHWWELETATKGWDGLWKDLLPLLVTCTTYDDEREDSPHKSSVGKSWQICHNKLLDENVFKSLSV